VSKEQGRGPAKPPGGAQSFSSPVFTGGHFQPTTTSKRRSDAEGSDRAPTLDRLEDREGSEGAGTAAPEAVIGPDDEVDPRSERERPEDAPEEPSAPVDVALPVHVGRKGDVTRLPAGTFRLGLNTTEIHVGGEIKHRAVISPGAVRGPLARGDAPEEFALGREHVDAARTGCP